MAQERIECCARSVYIGERRMRVLLMGVGLAVVMTLLPWTAGAQLSPAIQADLYLVQTEEYLKQKDYAAAQEAMEKTHRIGERTRPYGTR